jgi:hypothetical protein
LATGRPVCPRACLRQPQLALRIDRPNIDTVVEDELQIGHALGDFVAGHAVQGLDNQYASRLHNPSFARSQEVGQRAFTPVPRAIRRDALVLVGKLGTESPALGR